MNATVTLAALAGIVCWTVAVLLIGWQLGNTRPRNQGRARAKAGRRR